MAKLKTISFSLYLCLLLSPCGVAQTGTPVANAEDRVTITPQIITFPRKQSPVRRGAQPDEKTVIIYPVITGLRNETVLKQIQSTLQLQNVFGSTVEEYRDDEVGWLEKLGYTVNYNKDYILDLTFTEFGSAIHGAISDKHFTIDLHTGKVVTVTDIFRAEQLDQLGKLVDAKLQQEIKTIRDRFQETGDEVPAPLDDIFRRLKIETADLSNFEVNQTGIVFIKETRFPYGFGFHSSQPTDRYHFKYVELKPYLRTDGLLWQFVD